MTGLDSNPTFYVEIVCKKKKMCGSYAILFRDMKAETSPKENQDHVTCIEIQSWKIRRTVLRREVTIHFITWLSYYTTSILKRFLQSFTILLLARS